MVIKITETPSKRIKYDAKKPFVQLPCPHKQKYWEIDGKEKLIKCGSYHCRICSHHSPIQGELGAFYCFYDFEKRELLWKK